MLELLKAIKGVSSKIGDGRAPSFNEAHVVKVLEIVGKYGTVGRIRLSKELELGEGATRTLLKHLKREGIVKGSRQGITFSEHGRKLFSDLRSKISEGFQVPNSPLTVGPFNIAVLVRDAAHGIKRGVEQRDMAIKAGALGATTLIFSQNKLIMPSSEKDVFEDVSSMCDILVSMFAPKENDVIIVGTGENKKTAETGAKMAALELLRSGS